MSQRIDQLDELLKREVSTILLKEESLDRRILITVTRAETTPDLSEAKIFVSVMPKEKEEEMIASFKKDIYSIQQKLNKRLCLKKVPKIIFYKEEKVKEAGRIEKLISEIHKNEKKAKSF